MGPDLGRSLVVLGLVISWIGLAIWFGPRVPFLGRLPGDVLIERDYGTIFTPIGSMLLVSVVLTIVLNVIAYVRR